MTDKKIKTIDFENHFYTQECHDYLMQRTSPPCFVKTDQPGYYQLMFNDQVHLLHSPQLMAQLLDIGDGRVALMDQAGVDVQIISSTGPSGIECLDNPNASALAEDANNQLADAIKRHPTRFKAFSALAPNNIKQSIKELERTITQLGFAGWLTHSNFGCNEYLDDKKYWPLLEAAEGLKTPIYLHPTIPQTKDYGQYGFATAGNALGFQFDTALCLMRMISNGVFDQFPNLTIILGHLGETLPWLMERLDWLYAHPGFSKERPQIKKWPSQVLRENVYVTTSGRFYMPAFNFTLSAMGSDRILLATDHPYESLTQSMDFIRDWEIATDTREKLSFANAQKLGIEI